MTRDAVRERLGAPARRELGPDFVNWRYRRRAMEVTFKPRLIAVTRLCIPEARSTRWCELPRQALIQTRADVTSSRRRELLAPGRRRSTCRCGSSARDVRRARDRAHRSGLSPGG